MLGRKPLLSFAGLIGALFVGLFAAPASAAIPATLEAFDQAKTQAVLPDGVTLSYLDIGDPKGRPVVLIHGYTDNARDWWPVLPYLDPHWRLIVVDIRGHGLSSKPECCYTRLDFAYDIKLLLDHLGIAKADIVGHSLGSIIAQTFAEYWPEHTRRAVLISSTGKLNADGAGGFDFVSEIRKLKEPIDPDSPFMIAWWSSPTPVDPDYLRRQRLDSVRIPLKVWLAVLDQGLGHDDLQATLPRLTAPTLLVWGEKDPLMGPLARKALIEGLPGAKVTIFPGLGHNPFWEEPAKVGAELNTFLNADPDPHSNR